MKIHCINILLFALPLNILVNTHKKTSITPLHTPKRPTTRLLCECELYSPANYDNDPQMKEVMENFIKQTQERFYEYDERMKTTRQKCKEQCEKDIQKIILKDKLEKELVDKFVTLHTDIQSDAIPTCVCEKSIADKMEKGCLRCAGVLGGGVMPGMGLIDGSLLGAISVLQPLEIAAAKDAAIAKATDAAIEAGINTVVSKIKGLLASFTEKEVLVDLTKIVTPSTYNNGAILHKSAMALANKSCDFEGRGINSSFCNTLYNGEKTTFEPFAKAGIAEYNATYTLQKEALETANVDMVKATYASYQTAIIASIVAIVVIVLIMVIIYKILRYRRKKKMKKKLQYIKLLKE
ncbi:hypothetical protein PFNF54_00010 [Plasmodium falciparum NF54]|uniref:Rifin n=1 Tax=Plasmodium falciparum (isolate NF54) TaxID=5843 RepID=W7KBS0_PLAFO|nr:hypothetical protein PFNF54_00010 [Plasmodium falciparum NF54]